MVTLIDTLNIIFIEYHIARKKLHDEGKLLDEENLPFYAHVLFSKLNNLFSTYGNLIFCWEGKNSLGWRRSIFPDYKMNRKEQKNEEEYKTLKSFFPKIQEALNYYPCKQIESKNAEADDIIYILSKKYKDEGVTIISTDGDLTQIRNFFGKNIEIYNPVRKTYAKEKPNIIEEKAICGDSSDNIPGLYRVGPKTFEKMLEDSTQFTKVLSKNNNKQLFESFKKIIDLREYPKETHEDILKIEGSIEYNKFKPENIEMFFWENKLKQLLDRWVFSKEEINIALKRVI